MCEFNLKSQQGKNLAFDASRVSPDDKPLHQLCAVHAVRLEKKTNVYFPNPKVHWCL
jgi:hypothetical protein